MVNPVDLAVAVALLVGVGVGEEGDAAVDREAVVAAHMEVPGAGVGDIVLVMVCSENSDEKLVVHYILGW